MRILHVITSLDTGGAEHLMVDLLPRLRDLGNEVELLIFDGTRTAFYEQLEKTGIKIHSLRIGGNVYNPVNVFKLMKFIRKYDIIHTHNTACQLFVPVAKCLAFGGAKLVTTEHSTSNRRRGKWYFKILDKWMYARYKKIICISEPSEDSLRGYLGDSYPIMTIKNGVDVGRFLNATPIDLGLGDCKKITMVAGFRYEKDQPTVIKSLHYLPEDYHVVLVGDGEKRPELETLVADEGLTERVHMLGIRTDVPQILKSSDVVVMSSHREGLSLSNVEGMCSGHPFVASDVEGLREVTEGYGLLFPHGDSQALASIIEKLCTDIDYAGAVVARCQERTKQYDISVMAENYYNAYHDF